MTNWNNWGNAWVAGGTAQVGTAAGGVSQDIASKLTPGTNYKLTGTANVSSASEGVFVGVRLFDAWGGMLVNQTQLVSSTAASGVSVSFTAPAGAASGYVFIWKNASNAVAIVGNLSLGAA
jgi:hypothetical protein